MNSAVDPYALASTPRVSNKFENYHFDKPKHLLILYSYQNAIKFCFLMSFFFLLLHLCYFVISVTKMHQ